MSMIDRMSIMGIRSFGVREKDTQVIEFQHPLTLIVGQNGAGKTTIIECLKYATTGDQPLNSKKAAFIHDPKLVGESQVKAQVRLKFFDVKGQKLTIMRSLQAIQKATGPTMQSIQPVLTIEKKNGESVSVNNRCIDINKEMISALGVSRAILDNVIFCHQEESSWPLSEGKVLKQKFDDIFAATRYTKALDVIKKTITSKQGDLREEETKKKYLKGHSETATEKLRELEDTRHKLGLARESVKQAISEMEPIDKDLREIGKRREEVLRMDRKMGEDKSRLEQMKIDRRRLEERIQNIFQGTDEQITRVQQGQEKLLKEKEQKMRHSQEQIEPISEKTTDISRKKSLLTLEQGKLQQEYEHFQKKNVDRTGSIIKLSEELDISQGKYRTDTEISSEDAEEFETEMKRLFRRQNESFNIKKKKLEGEVENCDSEIQNIRQTKTQKEEKAKHCQQLVASKKKKIEELSQEISHLKVASDSNRLEELQEQLEQTERELSMTEKSSNVEQLRQAVKELSQSKTRKEAKRHELDEKIMNMQRFAEYKTKIDMLKKDQTSKSDAVSRLKRRNADSLMKISLLEEGGRVEDKQFPTRQILARWLVRKESDRSKVTRELDKLKQELAEQSTRRDLLMKEQSEKNNRCKRIEEEIFELCGSENFDDDIKRLEEEIKVLQGSKGLTDGIQYMYEEFLKKLRHSTDMSNTPCPLCHRLFDEAKEVESLADELERKLELAPQKMLTQEEDLSRKKKRYKSLLQIKPAKDEMDSLVADVIPGLKRKATAINGRITQIRRDIDEKDKAVKELQEEESVAKSCSDDISQIDTALAEVKDLSRNIDLLEAKIPRSLSSEDSMESLNMQKQNLTREITSINSAVEEKRQKFENQTDVLNKLRQAVNSVRAEKLELTTDFQKCEQMKDNRQNLAKEVRDLKVSTREVEAEISPLEKKLAELDVKKENLVRRKDQEIADLSISLQELRDKLKTVTRANEELKAYKLSGKDKKLEKTQQTIQKVENELRSYEDQLSHLREEITQIQQELATCKERQRDLDDNIALRKQDKAIKVVEDEIRSSMDELQGFDSKKLERENTALSSRWHTLSKEKERCKTRQESYGEQERALKRELEKEDLKFAHQRYKESMIKATTLKLVMEDLRKYHNALDKAIMRFHHIKMNDINKSIRDIWQETYQGHDIDYIEICSDEDTSTKTTRRVYNYRLVKCCRGEKIDMRGRCSAGQKVLASIVIRLALAETFCISCGILALDEPTTNLDRGHIESLAHALIKITESREGQKNFQLIIITHDEDFVELIGRSHYADHFFRVSKKDGMSSRIMKCSMQTLCE